MISFVSRSIAGAGLVLALAVPSAHARRAPEASCYGPGLFGNLTADGTVLHPGTVGVASKTLALGTKLRVRTGGKTITVKVIDRGPYVAGRHLDLTQAAVKLLGFNNCDAWGHRRVKSWKAPS